MMNRIFGVMGRRLTSNGTDAKWGQFACWLASAVVLVFGMLKLTELPLTETEFFFGIMLVLTVGLLGVLIGLVLPMAVARDPHGPTT